MSNSVPNLTIINESMTISIRLSFAAAALRPIDSMVSQQRENMSFRRREHRAKKYD